MLLGQPARHRHLGERGERDPSERERPGHERAEQQAAGTGEDAPGDHEVREREQRDVGDAANGPRSSPKLRASSAEGIVPVRSAARKIVPSASP